MTFTMLTLVLAIHTQHSNTQHNGAQLNNIHSVNETQHYYKD